MNARLDSSHNKVDPRAIRFGPFVVKLDSEELFRGEVRIRIPGQSFQILAMLVAKPGVLVTREEMQQKLWSSDTFVDFDHGLSSAVKRLRESIGDSADNPHYIETLPKRGYRFIGTIERERSDDASVVERSPLQSAAVSAAKADAESQRPVRWTILGAVLAAAALVGAVLFVVKTHRTASETPRISTAVPFTSLPGLAVAPAFSPDGSRIAFAWSGKTNSGAPRFDLYVKAFGGEEILQLTHHPSEWICSAWSPDGTQVAFHRRAGADSGVYVVSALGGPERKLAPTRVPYDPLAPISWSPDGKWIAFGNPLTNEPLDRMFRVSLQTSEVIPFVHDSECLHEATPTFAHDGQRIFYSCIHSMYEGELRSRLVTGGAPTKIVAMQSAPSGITVSGDDARIGFASGYGFSGISIVDVGNRSARRRHTPPRFMSST